MAWARLDDRFHEHRKVRLAWRASPAAIGLHVMAMTYCSGHETDGLVDQAFVEEKLTAVRERDKAVAALVDAGLWVSADGGWLIHDYLEYNPSRADLDAKRVKDSERKARGRQTQSERRPRGHDAESAQSPEGLQATSSGPVPSRPVPTRPVESSLRSDDVAASDDRVLAEQVEQVWTAYDETRRSVLGARSAAKFTPERRALITRRLRDWPVEDLVDASRGWRHFPHNRGENDRGTTFCDLELIIRDAARIERFRDAERDPANRPTANGAGKPRAWERLAAADPDRDAA